MAAFRLEVLGQKVLFVHWSHSPVRCRHRGDGRAPSDVTRRGKIMQARMSNPAMTVPGALQALLALSKTTYKSGLPARTLHLIHLRANQINGCSVCIDMHAREAKQDG